MESFLLSLDRKKQIKMLEDALREELFALGIDTKDAALVSAKTGLGIEDLLEKIVKKTLKTQYLS